MLHVVWCRLLIGRAPSAQRRLPAERDDRHGLRHQGHQISEQNSPSGVAFCRILPTVSPLCRCLRASVRRRHWLAFAVIRHRPAPYRLLPGDNPPSPVIARQLPHSLPVTCARPMASYYSGNTIVIIIIIICLIFMIVIALLLLSLSIIILFCY
jgi:hypothetical protein